MAEEYKEEEECAEEALDGQGEEMEEAVEEWEEEDAAHRPQAGHHTCPPAEGVSRKAASIT